MRIVAATCFSGIGAPECAMPEWDWVWHSEIGRWPARIHRERIPGSVNIGDVTADDFVQRALAVGHPHVIVGGPPCQDFSTAGTRRGLLGQNGNLSLRWAEIIDATRPAVSVTENVTGWLSMRDNAFGAFLAALVGADDPLPMPPGESWPSAGMVAGPRARAAWRVLDAQYFGLPQRRKRVFVIGCVGASGVDPAAVLFEPKGMRWTSPPCQKEGSSAPTVLERGFGGGCLATYFDRDGCLIVSTSDVARCLNAGGMGRQDYESETFVAHALIGDGFEVSKDGAREGMAHALNTAGRKVVAFNYSRWDGASVGLSPTLRSFGNIAVATGAAVRRLTPLECERIQGFPDGWTAINGIADGPRYKALGNSMAVPVMRWILERIQSEIVRHYSPQSAAIDKTQGHTDA